MKAATSTTAPFPELPSLPRAALKIVEMVQDPNVDLQRLGRTVEMDPALATKLVRLSNSSMFGLSREVVSVRNALIVLGLRTVKMAALSFSLLESFPSGKEGPLLAEIWKRILVNAMGCRLISGLFGVDSEEAFLAGLLQDLGVLILAKRFDDKYFAVYERATTEEGADLRSLEKETFGISHDELGAQLLEHWRLPHPLIEAVKVHHDQDVRGAISEGALGLPVLLATVESVTNFLMYPTMTNLETFNVVAQCFGEGQSEVDKFVQRLELQVSELADLLDMKLPAGTSFEEVLFHARNLQESLRVMNREALPLRLGQELALAKRQGWPLTVLLIKLHDNKRIDGATLTCDRNSLLSQFGHSLQAVSRECDSMFRLTEEIYCVLAPNTTIEGIRNLVDRIYGQLGRAPLVDGDQPIKSTLHFGGVCVNPSDQLIDGEKLLRVAVENLGQAGKSDGFQSSLM